MSHKVIQVEERVPLLMNIPLSLQHLFAMFGATVLVPFLFKLNPNTCLFMNGVGTLLYIFLTKGKIPSYLGSSFAFISPVLLIKNGSTSFSRRPRWGPLFPSSALSWRRPRLPWPGW